MRSGADFSDELSSTGGILGRGGAIVAGFEVDLAQLGLGGKVHTESAPVRSRLVSPRRMVTPWRWQWSR